MKRTFEGRSRPRRFEQAGKKFRDGMNLFSRSRDQGSEAASGFNSRRSAMRCKCKTSTSIFAASSLAASAPTASGARAHGRARRSLHCAVGLSAVVFGLTVGFVGMAGQPVYAQEKKDDAQEKKQKEELKQELKEWVKKYRDYRLKELKKSFDEAQGAEQNLTIARACSAKETTPEIEKLEKESKEATRQLPTPNLMSADSGGSVGLRPGC